jgi:ubiquitin carboxyl-terminal hydrolase 5/13
MLTERELEAIWSISESGIKEPRYSDIVHNDECLFTYKTPVSEGGLFVNLRTWKGVSKDFLGDDVQSNNGSGVYLWMQHESRSVAESDKPAVEKLAINLPGGFQTSTSEIVKNHSVVIYHGQIFHHRRFALDDPDLPEPIALVAKAVGEHKGAYEQRQLEAWESIDERPVSKFADSLIQEPALEERKQMLADSSLWRCEISGDTRNLWLNLSDGFIGGGRRNFDGSGGSNGAIDHFEQIKRDKGILYPLAVKLGTITPDGTADVYSYEEDSMVTDPLLHIHLLHWGIDTTKLAKTDKTMAELELELNKDFAFDKIVEAGEHLETLTNVPGMKNCGNSCYLNSIVRLLISVPEIRERYIDTNGVVRRMLGRDLLVPGEHHPVTGTLFELSKCVNGSSISTSEPLSMSSLREQVTWNHSEFASHRQQDAVEFFLHIIKELTKAERATMTQNLSESLFAFDVEDRLSCDDRVRYSKKSELVLSVQVTKDDLIHSQEEEEDHSKRLKRASVVDFLRCLERTLGQSKLEGFKSPVTGAISENTWKSSALASMPQYLLVSVNRYYFTEKFEPAKLDCEVQMPEHLSLEKFRAQGAQPGEIELPDDSVQMMQTESDQADIEIVNQLTMMGFSESLVKQACVATKNSGPEQALQWCFENPNGLPTTSRAMQECNSDDVLILTSLGFTEEHARIALKATEHNPERAADWLLSRADQLDSIKEDTPARSTVNDGVGEYELMGIVSHLGSSPAVGHYVSHVKDSQGRWIIYNDELVAKSHKPPIGYGYLYMYRRK